jgi:hypothetical protein
MNNLVALWHHPADVDLTGQQFDPVELLSRARDRLADIPELEAALHLVDVALDEVAAWFGTPSGVRSTSYAGTR